MLHGDNEGASIKEEEEQERGTGKTDIISMSSFQG